MLESMGETKTELLKLQLQGSLLYNKIKNGERMKCGLSQDVRNNEGNQ